MSARDEFPWTESGGGARYDLWQAMCAAIDDARAARDIAQDDADALYEVAREGEWTTPGIRRALAAHAVAAAGRPPEHPPVTTPQTEKAFCSVGNHYACPANVSSYPCDCDCHLPIRRTGT